MFTESPLRTCLRAAACFAVAVSAAWSTASASAAEPASEFLEGLREKGYYDMAVLYLDRMENSDLVSVQFKQVVKYEKGSTLADASRTQRDFATRARMLDEANAALSAFVKENPKHKLTSAAYNKLGNLLVQRAQMMIERSQKPSGAAQKTQLLSEARTLFDQAHEVFANSLADIQKGLKGIKPTLDPDKDAEEIEYRDELRRQYLQAQLLSAAVLEEKADTAKANKKEYQELLTKAAEQYKEIYEDHRTRIAGLYAKLYLGRCYQKIAENSDASSDDEKAARAKQYQDALTEYTDLLEEPDDPPAFRLLKTKTLLLAIDCWLATDKPDAAVNRGLDWMSKMRPNESREIEWLELRLKLAAALKTHVESGEVTDPKAKRQFLKEARDMVKFVASNSADYKQDAQKLLLALGSDDPNADPQEKPPAKNFTEAKDYGREALDRMQASEFAIKNLPARIKAENTPEIKAELEKQLAEAQDNVVASRQEALDYFNQALSLADDQTTTDDLNVVRYFLCFLNYVEQNYYESAVLGEFLARRYPNSSGAKPSAKIAMAAHVKLYHEQPKDQRDFQARQVTGVADYITRRWPEAPEATEALNTLIPFMIQAGDLDRAMAYVEQIPIDSPVRGEAELKTGQAMWGRYLREMAVLRKAQQEGTPPADASAREAELDELKTKAQQVLTDGINRMKMAEEVDSIMATAVLSLAQIHVDLGEPEQAIPLLEDPKYGVMALVLQGHPATERPGFAAETYKTALRAYIGSLSTTSNSELTIKKARGVMENLRKAMGDDAEGQQRLVATYISLAKGLEQQLEISDEKSKQALSAGFETFLNEVKGSADRFDVLNWVAETFYSLGTGFDTGSGQLSDQAGGYYRNAVDTYEKILDRQKTDSTFMPKPELQTQVLMRMAMVLRRMGDYQAAVEKFADILRDRNTLISVQVEAALTLQQWGAAGGGNDKFVKATMGDFKDDKGKKIVWGWGRISQTTARYPDFRDTFHVARYNLALARYSMAQDKSISNQEKMKHLDGAKKNILATANIYREDLADRPEETKRYDTLLKLVQKALGEPTIGLKVLDTETASRSP